MKKKLSLILLLLCLNSCSSEYVSYHKEKSDLKISQKNIDTQIKNYSLNKISEISNLKIIETPNLDLIDEIVNKINNSKNNVYVEVYIFTEKKLQTALKNAFDRWIDVKIILEKNVYLAPYLNNKAYNFFKNNKIPIVWSNPKNYSLNHTKMMIVDDEVLLSTGNYSHSSFKSNREFFMNFDDQKLVAKLKDIFNHDFLWEKYNIYDENLVLSPFYSKDRFTKLIESASKSIKIYTLNFWSEDIKNLILQKSKENIDIKIIFPSLKKVESNSDEIELFKNNNIKIKEITKPNIHAKAILIDEKYLYLWSINFSDESMTKNREIWLIIKNQDIISYFLEIFNNDFSN